MIFFSSSLASYGNDLESLNGCWHIHAQKTEEIQPDQETEIMLYKNVFDRMYIDIKLSARTIAFGLDRGDKEVVDIENIVEEGNGFTLYIDHDPIFLTPLEGGLLKYEEKNNRIYLVLTKQLPLIK